MPPIRMTKHCPAATSPTKEATSRIEVTLPKLAKPGCTEGADDEERTAAQ